MVNVAYRRSVRGRGGGRARFSRRWLVVVCAYVIGDGGSGATNRTLRSWMSNEGTSQWLHEESGQMHCYRVVSQSAGAGRGWSSPTAKSGGDRGLDSCGRQATVRHMVVVTTCSATG
jgi:hypothetical protein